MKDHAPTVDHAPAKLVHVRKQVYVGKDLPHAVGLGVQISQQAAQEQHRQQHKRQRRRQQLRTRQAGAQKPNPHRTGAAQQGAQIPRCHRPQIKRSSIGSIALEQRRKSQGRQP